MKKANLGAIDNTQLITIIEKIESVNEQIDALLADNKENYTEAKSLGFDPKYIRKMIKLRKMDKDEIYEEDEFLKMYRNALGI